MIQNKEVVKDILDTIFVQDIRTLTKIIEEIDTEDTVLNILNKEYEGTIRTDLQECIEVFTNMWEKLN